MTLNLILTCNIYILVNKTQKPRYCWGYMTAFINQNKIQYMVNNCVATAMPSENVAKLEFYPTVNLRVKSWYSCLW